MLEGTGCHFRHGAGEAGTAPLGQHQAMGTEGLGTTHDRAQVVGIGNAIQGHQQGGLTDVAATIDQRAEIQGVGGSSLQHDALVHSAIGELPQASPGHLLHQHPTGLGLPQQLHEARLKAHLSSAPNAVDGPVAFQGRLGGVAPPDQVVGGAGIKAGGIAHLTHGHLHGNGTVAIARWAALRKGGASAELGATLGAPRTERAAIRAGGREAAALGAGAPIRTTDTTRCPTAGSTAVVEAASRTTRTPLGPTGTEAGTIRTAAGLEPARTTIGATGEGLATGSGAAFTHGTATTTLTAVTTFWAIPTVTALGTIATLGAPFASGRKGPGPATAAVSGTCRLTTTATATGATAFAAPVATTPTCASSLATVRAAIKTRAHIKQAMGLWVGVLELIQQLREPAGILKKEPAHHCLKSRRTAIKTGLPLARTPASPVASPTYQL